MNDVREKLEARATLALCLMRLRGALRAMENAAADARRAKDTNLATIIENRVGEVEQAHRAAEEALRELYEEEEL